MDNDPIGAIAARHADSRGALLVALQEIQDRAGYVPDAAVAPLAKALGIPEGDVLAVISFYHGLRTTPPGKHHIGVCRGDACAATGAHAIAHAVESRLGSSPGSVALEGDVSYDTVFCLGNCALSPAVSIDGEVYGRVTPERVLSRLEELSND